MSDEFPSLAEVIRAHRPLVRRGRDFLANAEPAP